MTASFDDALKPRKTPLPHLKVACNSPATLSNFESTTLKFRGFLNIANLSDHRIACEIGGASEEPRDAPGAALLKPSTPPGSTTLASTPPTRTSSSRQRFTGSHDLLSTFLKSHGPHMSESDRCTNCDGLRTLIRIVCTQPLCFAIAWFLVRSKLLADRLIERFGRDKL